MIFNLKLEQHKFEDFFLLHNSEIKQSDLSTNKQGGYCLDFINKCWIIWKYKAEQNYNDANLINKELHCINKKYRELVRKSSVMELYNE